MTPSTMRQFVVSALMLHASFGLAAEEESMGDFVAPGRADRMLAKRAPRDFGTFQVDCQNSESACNNACYYIRCQARNDPDANKITYIGPNGNNGEDVRNRIESGCNVYNPFTGSVCTNFPFSQKFSDKTATDWQCDEWPPALSQQQTFANKAYANSLRCMPGPENGSLGSKLGNWVNDRGGPYPNRNFAGAMSRDDYFRVDFLTNIGSADQNKVKFCLGQGTTNCGSDGMQFGMTEKNVGRGKIMAPYNQDGNDNKYALQNTVYANLYQCTVKFTREGDTDIKDIKLEDWADNNQPPTPNDSCTLSNNGDSCTKGGLPNDLQITRTGPFGSKIDFEYAPGQAGQNVNNFAWDSEMSGNGRGPWTNPPNDPNRMPLRYCKVVQGSGGGNTEETECWFPCYKNQDGQ